MFHSMHRNAWIGILLALLLTLPSVARAGAPLMCRPFEVGSEPVLPWGKSQHWNAPDPNYDLALLTTDTLLLLSPSAPIIARMENLRRAAIYSLGDQSVANELLTALLARTMAAVASGTPDPLAWFDAGYLVESYRQAGWTRSKIEPPNIRKLDGYSWILLAIELTGSNPEMEYAASLVHFDQSAAAEHRRRAVAGAAPGSLLAQTLERYGEQ